MVEGISTGIPSAIRSPQGRAGVLKRTTNEPRLMGPRDGWIKIGDGGIKHETFQSLINLFFPNIVGERAGEGGGGVE